MGLNSDKRATETASQQVEKKSGKSKSVEVNPTKFFEVPKAKLRNLKHKNSKYLRRDNVKERKETNELLSEVKETLKESKDKVIFITDEDMAIGIQIAIDQQNIDAKTNDLKEALAKKRESGALSEEERENIVALKTELEEALPKYPAKTMGVKSVEDIEILKLVLKEAVANKELPTYPLVLTFDERQQNINKKITKSLDNLKIKYVSYSLKQMRKNVLKAAIAGIIETLTNNDKMVEINKSLKDINAFEESSNFIDSLSKYATSPAIKTGFDKFDEALGGGLRAGRLYGLGAITSLGKTTFALQIADNIAMAGQDVLIFSLEMSRYELMGKSVSRGTYKYCKANNINKNNASSLQGILDFESLKEENRRIVDEAIVDYRDKIAKHINISEGVGEIGVKQIRELMERFCIHKSSNPVVIIDYLQIVAPFNDRLNDKQNIDKSVLELKRICRDYQVPVIVINSFNRANYLNEAAFESFKESGAIEYSCDVLIGLQLHIDGRDKWTENDSQLNKKRKAVNDAKTKSPREIEAIILKNRGYKAYGKINFKYFPEYDYFEEDEFSNQNRIGGDNNGNNQNKYYLSKEEFYK
jgi:replicative DNA helicase